MPLTDYDWVTPAEQTPGSKFITKDMFFEYCIGVWAASRYANIRVGDEKLRNIGLRSVTYWRAYHVGCDTYYFPPGLMPMRLDLDDFGVFETAQPPAVRHKQLFNSDWLRYLVPEMESFARELIAGSTHLFAGLAQYCIKSGEPSLRYRSYHLNRDL